MEVTEIEEALEHLMAQASTLISERYKQHSFTPILSGSMSEGTKCNKPDEFDFICMLHLDDSVGDPFENVDERYVVFETYTYTGKQDVFKMAEAFYRAIDLVFRDISKTSQTVGKLALHKNTFLLGDKISVMEWRAFQKDGDIS